MNKLLGFACQQEELLTEDLLDESFTCLEYESLWTEPYRSYMSDPVKLLLRNKKLRGELLIQKRADGL